MRSEACLTFFSLLLLTGVMSCSSGDSTGPTRTSTTGAKNFPDAFPENRGDPLAISEITTNSMIRWEDPAEIVYFTEGSSVTPRFTYIRALRLSDNTTRTLHTGGNSGGYLGYHGLFVSPDGKQFFASLSKPLGGDYDVYQIIPGAASVRIAPGTIAAGTLLPTPDSRGAVYFASPGSIGYYDVATQTSRMLGSGCGTPVAFSPDGKTLLCQTGNGVAMMSMLDGTVHSISSPGIVFPAAFHWDDKGIQVAYPSSSPGYGLRLRNLTTGVDTTLVKPYQFRPLESALYFNLTWSRDGKKIAFSTGRMPLFLEFPSEFVVYVIDIETGAMSHVAAARLSVTASDYAEIGKMSFSPDGGSLAYILGTGKDAEAYRASVQ